MTRKNDLNASQPASTQISKPLSDLIDARLSRRSALRGLLAGGAATVVAPLAPVLVRPSIAAERLATSIR